MSFSIARKLRLSKAPAAVESQVRPAFEAVYDENFSFAWRSLRSLGVPESALPDAAQEVFVVVLRRLDDYQPTASVRSWIFGIARRVAKDFRRSAERRGVTVPLNEEIASASEGDPHSAANRNEALRWVEEFMETLSEDRRALFMLSEIEELPLAEVSEILKVNPNTLYSRLQNIKGAFEKFIAKRRAGGKGVFS